MGSEFFLSRRSALTTVLSACWLAVGCSSGPDVQLVGGFVTLDKEPLEGASVIFSPVDNTGLAAVGRTDAEGRFRLSARTSPRYGQGTVAGEYRVVVSKLEQPEQPDERPEQQPDTYVEPKELLPRVYTSEKTTPFRANVKPGTNEFTFELKSSGN